MRVRHYLIIESSTVAEDRREEEIIREKPLPYACKRQKIEKNREISNKSPWWRQKKVEGGFLSFSEVVMKRLW